MTQISRLLRTTNWKYALGEVLLIVVGVSIALWADAWVDARGASEKEVVRLFALRDNVEKTVAEIRDARAALRGASDALRAIATVESLPSGDGRLLGQLRYGLLYGSGFYPEQNVYEDLKNSGELSLLSNDDLRRALASMEARLELVRYAQADLSSVQQLNIDAYMVRHLDLRWLYDSMQGFGDIKGDAPQDFSFIDDAQFRNLMLLKLDLVTQLGSELESAQMALEEVLALIDGQLES